MGDRTLNSRILVIRTPRLRYPLLLETPISLREKAVNATAGAPGRSRNGAAEPSIQTDCLTHKLQYPLLKEYTLIGTLIRFSVYSLINGLGRLSDSEILYTL